MEPVALIFADDIDQDEFLDLVVSLGGERRPDPTTEVRLTRGDSHVWVITEQSGNLLPLQPEEIAEYGELLGAEPRAQVVLDMSDEAGTDLLAFEIIEAAAKRWRFVVDSSYDAVYTVDELRERVACGRPMVFVDPGRRFALHLADQVDPAEVLAVVESLGGVLHPDERVDARLSRHRDHVWLTTRETPTSTETASAEAALGSPPRSTVGLYLTETRGAVRLATELVEAMAARWRFVVTDDHGDVQPSVSWEDDDSEGDDER